MLTTHATGSATTPPIVFCSFVFRVVDFITDDLKINIQGLLCGLTIFLRVKALKVRFVFSLFSFLSPFFCHFCLKNLLGLVASNPGSFLSVGCLNVYKALYCGTVTEHCVIYKLSNQKNQGTRIIHPATLIP